MKNSHVEFKMVFWHLF